MSKQNFNLPFDDMLTTQDVVRCTPSERKANQRENRNQRNATEGKMGKNYGKKKKSTPLSDACKSKKKK